MCQLIELAAGHGRVRRLDFEARGQQGVLLESERDGSPALWLALGGSQLLLGQEDLQALVPALAEFAKQGELPEVNPNRAQFLDVVI